MVDNFDFVQLGLRKFVAPELIFGIDARLLAANYCKNLGGKKIFLITDIGITHTPWFKQIENELRKQQIDYHIFTSLSPNPRDYEVMEGASEYHKHKCNLILAIGGGSVIDCAKGVGIVSSNHKHIRSYEGVDRISKPMPPLICIPTTSGASAEVSQFAIINNVEAKYKMAIISKAVVPDAALIDPLVLTTMSSFLTACTGMDTLSHAFEAFVSNASSPISDLFALKAIQLIHENLLKSVASPHDVEVRGKVMLASLYAGLAFSNASLGCVHSLAHSLGGYLDLPHGECNALLLSHVVNFNYEAAEARYKKIAETLGLNENKKDNTLEQITAYLHKLNSSLGIYPGLTKRGVSFEIIHVLAENAIKDPCNATNPRPPSLDDLEKIYKEAM